IRPARDRRARRPAGRHPRADDERGGDGRGRAPAGTEPARPLPGRPVGKSRAVLLGRPTGQDHDLPRPNRADVRRRPGATARPGAAIRLPRDRPPLRDQRPAPRRYRPVLGSAADRELVLRVPDPLLELPAVGRRLPRLDAFELRPRFLELSPRPPRVDLSGCYGVVDEGDRGVLEPREDPRPGRNLLRVAVAGVPPLRARL